MTQPDAAHEKLVIKLVYYGPALSGKTTNLQRLHDEISSTQRGELIALDTRNDRTLFFDLLPLGVRAPSGLLVKLKVFTVPGQVQHDSTRKAILADCHGVVFVADSQLRQTANNAASFGNLADNLAKLGRDIERFPVVLQFNKRDLPEIVPEEELAQRWGPTPWGMPALATALKGIGVGSTFRELLLRVLPSLEAEHGLAGQHGLTSQALLRSLGLET
ncbi:Rab family GTPase [Schlegelella sp. S2-27]|uniref:Rab family GTPase n=1 Tax=Caldimonas mangrovi TaxID=2944811 RepID=A0ABT0YSA8_9BURK|nr:Rab family GTPase [Caldimonas mangrovi]MCM5681612.1 Rab family GTPase [Caldimonas mangrovi]